MEGRGGSQGAVAVQCLLGEEARWPETTKSRRRPPVPEGSEAARSRRGGAPRLLLGPPGGVVDPGGARGHQRRAPGRRWARVRRRQGEAGARPMQRRGKNRRRATEREQGCPGGLMGVALIASPHLLRRRGEKRPARRRPTTARSTRVEE